MTAQRVGDRLREIRRERRLSQEELAEMLHISQSALSHYERGARQIECDQLPRFANVLGVRPSAFYGEEERPVTVAEAIRIMDAYVRTHDDHPSAPSGYPTATASHPASNGGHPGHDRMLPEAEWQGPFWTVARSRQPALATR
jgi:transcriptional regulator with XRE-family HTH domain